MAEWLSYASTIDGKRAYIDFDASLDDPEHRAAHAHVCELTVSGFPVDRDGLPTDAADDQLFSLEQRLEAILSGRDGDIAVMTASAGAYMFVAYGVDDTAASEFSAAANEAGFQSSVATRVDARWEAYRRWALTGEPLEVARDRAQVDELGANGVDLTAEHEIYFDYEFADADSADRGTVALHQAGMRTPGSPQDDGVVERDPDDAIVQALATVIPTAENIGTARRQISAILEPLGAEFLGWGCDPDL